MTPAEQLEMLELAAKAAGYEVAWEGDCVTGWMAGGSWWNPLTDDGDALRLAVRLNLVVDCSRPSAAPPFCRHSFEQAECADFFVATRLAITRAAAEIGKAMP